MKEKIIDYIELLEAKAKQNDKYYKERLELYISNQEKDKQLKLYENMRKELINFIEEHKIKDYYGMEFINTDINNLLNILNKVGGSDD